MFVVDVVVIIGSLAASKKDNDNPFTMIVFTLNN